MTNTHAYVTLSAIGEVAKINLNTQEIEQTLRLINEAEDESTRPNIRAIAIYDDQQKAVVSRFVSHDEHGTLYTLDITNDMEQRHDVVIQKDHGPDTDRSGRGL